LLAVALGQQELQNMQDYFFYRYDQSVPIFISAELILKVNKSGSLGKRQPMEHPNWRQPRHSLPRCVGRSAFLPWRSRYVAGESWSVLSKELTDA
jgi:hypothetical protein